MSLTGRAEWKEILTVTDETGNSFTFSCGWGVEPPVAYLPAAADWIRCVPPWLSGRRAEVITVMQQMGHAVADDPNPDYLNG